MKKKIVIVGNTGEHETLALCELCRQRGLQVVLINTEKPCIEYFSGIWDDSVGKVVVVNGVFNGKVNLISPRAYAALVVGHAAEKELFVYYALTATDPLYGDCIQFGVETLRMSIGRLFE